MLGPFCAICHIDFDYQHNVWSDGQQPRPPEFEPSIITCPTCRGLGSIDNPKSGQHRDTQAGTPT